MLGGPLNAVWVQVLSTLLAGLGFAGYHPPWGIAGAKFTELSNGQQPLFLASTGNRVPLAHTEAEFVASVIGCGCAPAFADVNPPLHIPLVTLQPTLGTLLIP